MVKTGIVIEKRSHRAILGQLEPSVSSYFCKFLSESMHIVLLRNRGSIAINNEDTQKHARRTHLETYIFEQNYLLAPIDSVYAFELKIFGLSPGILRAIDMVFRKTGPQSWPGQVRSDSSRYPG